MVTLSVRSRDLKRGTLASIIRQVSMTVDEFLALLYATLVTEPFHFPYPLITAAARDISKV